MRIGKGDVGTHERETVSKEHAGFVHPIVTKGDTFGLSGKDNKRAHDISREAGPRASLEALSE